MNAPAILRDPAFDQLRNYILDHTGLNYYSDKDEDLAARIGRRCAARNVHNCTEYFRLLVGDASGQEHEDLAGELTIGETYFFRQPEHFRLLRDVIVPDVMQRNAESHRIRIWSAGCATGAEPYSIALLLRLELASQLEGWDVQIIGTDINAEFLKHAQIARYGRWALRDVPDEIKASCFDVEGKYWRLRPEYRKAVSFHRLNLVGPAPYPGVHDPFDIVLCRNVLIYFSTDTIRTVAGRLYDSIAAGGWLLVGHAEPNPYAFQQFSAVCQDGSTAYHKLPPATTPPGVPFVRTSTTLPVPPEQTRPRLRRSNVTPPQPASRTIDRVMAAADVRRVADRGLWSEAEDLCRRLIEAEPLNAPNHYTLGLILAHASNPERAEPAFRRAIYLDRGFALAHYHLATTLKHSSPARARKSFDNVLVLLNDMAPDDQIPEGDGMTVDELAELARMHVQVLPTVKE